MGERRRENLSVVDLPVDRHILSAPPVLIASTPTVDYCCGYCGTVLLHADTDQVHNVVIHCMECGRCNSTGI